MLWPVANMSWCFWMPGAELNGVFHTYAPTPRGQSWLVFMHPKCPGSLSGGLCVNFRCGTWGWAGLPARPPLLRHVVLSWWFPLVWGWGGLSTLQDWETDAEHQLEIPCLGGSWRP